MTEMTSGSRLSIARLILIPAAITLGITLLRMVGELEHWSDLLFNRSAGGAFAPIGIWWLPFILGPYFAIQLAGSGERPESAGKAIGFAALGLVLFAAGVALVFAQKFQFPAKTPVATLLVVGGAAMQFFSAWPAFTKTLLAYGYAARIPVAILMLFAIQGSWGTHYDVLPPNYNGPMDLWGKYLMIAVLPQMIFWVCYTIVTGALSGTIAAAIACRGKAAPQAAT